MSVEKLLRFMRLDYEQQSDDYRTECLLCHHHSVTISGDAPFAWQCWNCKESGSGQNLLTIFYDSLEDPDAEQAEYWVGKKPGITRPGLMKLEPRIHNGSLICPVRSQSETILALYRFAEDRNCWISTSKPFSCPIIGQQNLKSSGPVYLTEGHWDYAAFCSHTRRLKGSVLCLCGSSFPAKHAGLLEDRDIIFLGDNDEAGQNGGKSILRAMKKSGVLPRSLKTLDWEQVAEQADIEINDKFDIRDLCYLLLSNS